MLSQASDAVSFELPRTLNVSQVSATISVMSTILWTLPGWPEVAEPTVLEQLAHTVIWPVALALPIFVIGMGSYWYKKSRSGASQELEHTS